MPNQDYLKNMLKLSGEQNVTQKIIKCSPLFDDYMECVNNGGVFNDCYLIHYKLFTQCINKIDNEVDVKNKLYP